MPLRVALLSKFPPLEGGIASRTYWLAKGLAARGCEVHVITDQVGASPEYEIEELGGHSGNIPHLRVHRPEQAIPWHIPQSDERPLALLGLAMRVVREHHIDLVDTGYLVPYGVVGYLVKQLAGIPHVMRHGGSDLAKFLKNGVLGSLLGEAIAKADMVITDAQHQALLGPMASQSVVLPPYVPDEDSFRADRYQSRILQWRIAAIGKINYFWQHKKLNEVAAIMGYLHPHCKCVILGQGNGRARFREGLEGGIASTIEWRQFVAPWEMPEILNGVDAIFAFEMAQTHPVISNTILEALSCGVGIITDRPDLTDAYKEYVAVNEEQILAVPGDDPARAAEMIMDWLPCWSAIREPCKQKVTFEQYIALNLDAYDSVLDAVGSG